jgi:phosphatidylserine synthase
VAFAAGYAGPINWFIYFFYAASLVMRLAHFEVYGKEKKGSKEFFTGMPTTMSVLILPIVFAVVVTVPSPLSELLIPAAFVAMGLLFIVNVQMQDLRTSGFRRLLLVSITVATIIFWLYRLFAG